MRDIFILICALALAKGDPVRTNLATYDEADPKQAPLICATTDSDGILVAHEHCNQFYQCWNGKPVARLCYGFLQYNPSTEVCDWPDKVNCGDRINPELCHEDEDTSNICTSAKSADALIPHKDCNKFYRCQDGNAVTYQCPGDLLYNAAVGYCDCADRVVCAGRHVPENEASVENGSSELGENDNNGNGNCDPSEAPAICAAEGSSGILVAHESCNKFYKCDHGLPVVFKCYGELVFDPAQGRCEWPHKVDCGNRTISEYESNEVDNGGNGNGSGEDENSNGGYCDPSEAGNICAAEGSNGILIAHENCRKYYICNHGVPVAQRCPGDLLFNWLKNYCDWPHNVDCGERFIPDKESAEEVSESGNVSSENGGIDNGGTGNCNCNPGVAPEICAVDGSDGILIAHENCNQYYTCVHGRPVAMPCPGTLLYNPYTQQCDWPQNVDCGDRVIPEVGSEETDSGDNDSDNSGNENEETDNGGSDNGGSGTCNCIPGEAPEICAVDGSDSVLIAHESCNKFYTCVHGRPVAMSCSGNLLYNPYTQQCDWPENVDCGDRVIPEKESEESGNGDNGNGDGGIDNGSSDNGGSDNGGSGTCNCNPGEAPEICSVDGSDGVLIAHESCNKFYTCVHGRPVAMSCSGNLLYNPYTQQCDWPENVDCGDRVISEKESEESDNGDNDNGDGGIDNGGTDNGGSDNGGSGTCNCNPGEAPEICAVDGSDGVLIAHESCNKFYTCVHGRPVAMSCSGNLLYNPYTQQCDWPENVDCGDRVISEKESEESNNGDSGNGDGGTDNGGSDNGGSGTCNCNPGEAPEICAVDGSDGVLIAHESCNKFYTCVHGRPVAMSCSGNLLYNPYTQQCDWPENVDCGDRVIPEKESEESNNGDNGNGDGGIDNGGTDNGGSDNGGSGTCNCNPGEAPEICSVDGSDGVLIAHESCNKFYTCVHGRPVAMSCSGSLLYNPYTQQCDWPENVDCGDRVIPEKESEESNNGDNGNGDGGIDNGGTDNGGSDNGGSGTCNCNPGEAPEICSVDGSDGVLIAHESCNKFYTCVHGRPVAMSCSGNLLYNPYTQQCDWAENVDCGDRVIQEIESEETDSGDNGNGDGGIDNGGSDNGGSDNGGSGICNCNPGEAPEICAVDGSDGVLIAHESCNKFYTCVHGRPVGMSCSGNLLYNPYTQQCDWPENVDCGDRVIQEIESEETDSGDNSSENGGTENGETDNGGSDNGGSSTCNCNPGEAPEICADDGSDGVLIAHENCNKYYTCVHGRPVAMSCSGNLLYNPYTQQCDWAENVDCGDRVIQEIESEETDSGDNGSENGGIENGETDNGGSDNGGSGTCNCNPGEAPEICADDGSDGVLIAHENCNKYYTCVHGRPVAMSCSGILLYNPYTLQCDWPENVDCGDRVIPEKESEESDNGDNGNGNGENDNGGTDNGGTGNGETDNNGSDNGGSGTCNCDPGEAPGICAVDGSDGTLIAHEVCNQYYACVHGRPVAMSCSGILLYNPYTQQCDWPENVDCGDRVIVEKESEETDDGNNGNGNGEIDNGGSDNGSTDNGGSDNGSTDNGGSDNDSSDSGESGTCNCNPGEALEICAVDGSGGVLIAHESCNKYYTCVHGRPVAMSCSGTLLYNPYTQQCDWPENVDCGDRVIPEDCEEDTNDGGNTGSENGGSDNGESDNGSSDNGNSDNGGSGTCNCSPGEAPAICAVDGSDGVLIAHENCNQYYSCVHGKPVSMSCSGTLLYNPYTQRCDWPENVDCGDRVISEDCEEDTNGNGGSDNGGSDNGGSDNGGSDNGGSDNGGSDNGGSGTCNCSPGEAPAICAVDGSDGVLIAHENCNQFYSCVNGIPVAMPCSGSLLYNPYTQRCDWPENVDCGDRVIPEDCEEDTNDGGNPGSENGGSDNGESDNGSSDNGNSDNGGSGTCNCSPGEAPAICAVDGSDGVLIAHENCNQYYSCVHGKPVSMSCSGTLLYNPYTQRCDWPENVDCGDRVIPEDCEEDTNGGGDTGSENGGSDNGSSDNGSSDNGGSDNGGSDNGGSGTCNCSPGEAPAICAVDGSDGVLIAHENCNQFYSCVNGIPVAMPCSGSLLYNPYTQRCDWPENVDCGDRVIPEDCEEDTNGGGDTGSENGGSDNGESDNGSSDNGNSDNGGSGTCNCSPGEAPAICAVDGSDGVLIAHENCNQYYSCVHGKPVSMSCSGTLLYNPYTQRCDWPENVDCGDRVISEDCEEDTNGNGGSDNGGSDNGGSDNGGSDNGGSGTCNCSPGEAPAICAVDGSDGTLVAHENCNQYYSCVNGKPVAMSCSGILLYNPYTQRCDWPDNVDCGDRVIPEDCEEDTNSGGDTGSENGGTDNGDSNTCNCNPAEAPAICAANGSDGFFVAHENCNQFYTCVGGQPVTMNCSGILLYNPYSQRCDWPENVDCGDRVIAEDCEEESNGNGSSDNGGSDNDGSDNGGSGTCNCSPGEAPAICAVDGSDGTLVAHENCNQYYSCVNGKPVAMSCSGTLLYNPYTQRCDWPDNVDCGDRVIPEDCEEDTNSGGDTDSENGGTDNGDSNTCNCNPAEASAICAADGSDGFFVAHENCNQFYTCVGGQPVTMNCSGILLYNPYSQHCDWPENVDCGDSVSLEDTNNKEDGDNGNGGDEDSGSDNANNCNCNPEDAPAICAADGSEGVYVAHKNCNQFFTCVGGEPVTMNCSGFTLYDPVNQICDWPENVACGERLIPITDISEDKGTDEENQDGYGDDYEEKVAAFCIESGNAGKYLPHEICNHYYACQGNAHVVLRCSGILLFNDVRGHCDWPENVVCGHRHLE